MSLGSRAVKCAFLLAALIAFRAVEAFPAEAGSAEGTRKAAKAPGDRSIRLSLKISKAKQRAREHAFYQSVARQRKVRPVNVRNPPSGR